jgi:hypothetical protein
LFEKKKSEKSKGGGFRAQKCGTGGEYLGKLIIGLV